MRPVCNYYNKQWLLCAILFHAPIECEQQKQLLTTTTTFIPVHTMPVYVGSRDIVPVIGNLSCRWRCLVRITSQTLYPFESNPVPIKHEAVWAPEAGWM
jgi:hypothetical protein